jgi:hypothetical protein
MPESEILRSRLEELIDNFKHELQGDDLRTKVIALIPAYKFLNKLGSSLIPIDSAAARDRILYYFRKYPFVVISKDEIMVIAGISEWARRLRELRVELGWSIISGTTAKEMAKEGEFIIDGIDANEIKAHQYILTSQTQDKVAAYRWRVANHIRKTDLSVRNKLLEYFKKNIGDQISGEELRYVADEKTEWARRVRELRTEFGWQIATKTTGRPDLPVGFYVLESDRQAPEHDRKIPDPVRREVLQRDKYKCHSCGWSYEQWNPSDPRHLEAHHIKHHVKGGKNIAENLITLCNICHDKEHAS